MSIERIPPQVGVRPAGAAPSAEQIQAQMEALSAPGSTPAQYQDLCATFARLAQFSGAPAVAEALRTIAPRLLKNYHFDPAYCLYDGDRPEPLIAGIVSSLASPDAKVAIEGLTKGNWMTKDQRRDHGYKLDRLTFSLRDLLFPAATSNPAARAARGSSAFECLEFALDADDETSFTKRNIEAMNRVWGQEASYMTPQQRTTLQGMTARFIAIAQSYRDIPTDAFQFSNPAG